jgi:ferrochelatase
MAHGTATGPEDIERYCTDVRGGRPPSPGGLAELRERFAAIGNRFPLLGITSAQAAGLGRELDTRKTGSFRTYLGMKHSPPFIPDGIAEMRRDGVERAIGIVMAPHWSAVSTEAYFERVRAAIEREGGPVFSFVRGFRDHPGFVELLARRLGQELGRFPELVRARAAVLFSAHSLPVRTLPDGSERCLRCTACEGECQYRAGLQETADLVARTAEVAEYSIAWQSAARTPDRWWEPAMADAVRALAKCGHAGVVVCPAGFVADNLEILFDLDIQARAVAEGCGMAFGRTEMPNAEPEFIRVLADVVLGHLEMGSAP